LNPPTDLKGWQFAEMLLALEFRIVSRSSLHVDLRHRDVLNKLITFPRHGPLKAGIIENVLRDVCEITATSREQVIENLGW
jgi:hypothetical protein